MSALGMTSAYAARRQGSRAAIAAAALLLLVLPSCGVLDGCARRHTIDAYRASPGAAPQAVSIVAERRRNVPATPAPPVPAPVAPRDKVHPLLWAVIPNRSSEYDTVLVTFVDPDADSGSVLRRVHGSLMGMQLNTAQRQHIADSLMARRQTTLGPLGDTLNVLFGAQPLQRLWMAHALLVRIQLGQVPALAARADVLAIEPLHTDSIPQSAAVACGTSETDVAFARGLMRTDAYASSYGGIGDIAILDSGVRTDHELLSGTGRLGAFFDCFTDPDHCTATATQADASTAGHGTSTAAILVAGPGSASPTEQWNPENDRLVGLTRASIASYQVYPPPPAPLVANPFATATAMQDAYTAGHDVIIVEVASGFGLWSSLTQTAHEAYEAGRIVVTANGNKDTRDIPAPANSPFAIGVGAQCVNGDPHPHSSYTRGRTPDGRVKPDLGAPTYIVTASNTSPTSTQNFSGTSCATPFAGGSALLLKRWMESSGATISPGLVYAMLYLCGSDGAVSEDAGAGLIALPDQGLVWWGILLLEEGTSETIPLDPETPMSRIRAACWWPEYDMASLGFPRIDRRAQIGLTVSDPDGESIVTSDVEGSVFQVASAHRAAGAATGAWSLRLDAPRAPALPGHETEPHAKSRFVYWAAWLEP